MTLANLLFGLAGFIFLFMIFFAVVAARNRLLKHFSTAATQIRKMARGLPAEFPRAQTIPEADDLFKATLDLSQELQAQSKMIKRLERMRIDFVANVSHELKTPLTSIKGYTETLKSGALKDPEVGPQFLNRIEENTDRLTAIISDLLLLSHVESFPGDVHWSV